MIAENTQRRTVVFAHWDPQNRIEEYVVYYIRSLSEICDAVIFVSDCDLDETECDKVRPYTKGIIAQFHGEYDFGSYKRGFQYALSNGLLHQELLLVNDSCFGPLFPLEPIFEQMDKISCDYWGMIQEHPRDAAINSPTPVSTTHVQSYFLVLKEQVWKSDCFQGFINQITRLPCKNDIVVKYEVGLSQILSGHGFIGVGYVNSMCKKYFGYKCLDWKYWALHYQMPLIKTHHIRTLASVSSLLWKPFIQKHTHYPASLIEEHVFHRPQTMSNLAKCSFLLSCGRKMILRVNRDSGFFRLFGLWFPYPFHRKKQQ